MKFLLILLCGVATWFAFKTNVLLGFAVMVAFIAYGAYKFMPSFYRLRGQKCFGMGDFAGAEKMYKKAVDTGRGGYQIRLEYSYMLLRTGRFEEAEQQVSYILSHKLTPAERNNAVLRRCMCYYKLGNLEEAISDAQELYDEGYKSMALYALLGYFKIIIAPNSEDTFNFCLEAYDYADDDRDICDNLLICYYNRGEYEKAKEISDKVIEKAPKFVEAWYHAAQIDYKMKNYEEALEKLDKINDCIRSEMTTISEEEIKQLRNDIEFKLRVK